MEINIVELASKLASNEVTNELLNTNDPNSVKDENDLFDVDEDGVSTWKEYPQKVFNKWYDFYLDIIETCKE